MFKGNGETKMNERDKIINRIKQHFSFLFSFFSTKKKEMKKEMKEKEERREKIRKEIESLRKLTMTRNAR